MFRPSHICTRWFVHPKSPCQARSRRTRGDVPTADASVGVNVADASIALRRLVVAVIVQCPMLPGRASLASFDHGTLAPASPANLFSVD